MFAFRRIGFIFLLISLVWLMGCGGKEEPTAEATAVPQPTTVLATSIPANTAADPTKAPAATAVPQPTTAAPTAVSLPLGEPARNEEGGFTYQPIPDYEVTAFSGMTNMLAPGADPDVGPMVLMMGGLTAETTNEALYELLKSGTPMTVGPAEPITLAGLDGLAADITGDNNGKAMQGRVALLMVTPTQQFTLLIGAPAEQWVAVEPYFEGLLTAVTFFDPIIPPPTSNLEPGSYSYVNSNVVRDLVVVGDWAYAATLGGMVAWDLTTGQGLLDGDSDPYTPRFDAATPLQGMSHINAYAITTCKLANGEPRVLVGTMAGLSQFDPYNGKWETPLATPADSLIATSQIDRLFCDQANGRLLIGYSGLGVLDLTTGDFVRYTKDNGLSWNQVSDTAVNGSDIWVASGYNGLAQISNGQITIHNVASGMPDERAYSLAFAPDGTLWVGGSTGLMRYSGGQWTFYDVLADINEMELAADGTLWLAQAAMGGGKLCHFDPRAEACAVEFPTPDNEAILALTLDEQGRPVYGTNKGVYLFDEAAATAVPFINETDMLLSNSVDALAIAPDGLLWLGTPAGIQTLDPAFPDMLWTTYTKALTPGIGGNWGQDIAFAPDGTAWIAMTNGNASRYQNGAWQSFDTIYSYDSVAVDAQNRAWFGKKGKGIIVLNADGSTAMQLTTAEGLPSNEVMALLADGESMWIALDSGVARYADGQATLVLDKNSLPHPYVRALALDAAGNLLIGANLSIVRYDGVQPEVLINFQQEKYMDWLTTLAVAPNGRIWAGTANGLFYSDDGRDWIRMTIADGLLTNTIASLKVDPFGALWIGGGGLLHIVP